jgi:hypothetical protein
MNLYPELVLVYLNEYLTFILKIVFETECFTTNQLGIINH